MKISFKSIIALISVGLLGFGLLGLSACTASEPEPVAEEEAHVHKPQFRSIGGQKDSALMLQVTNATDSQIVGFAIGYSAENAVYGPSIVTRSTQVELGETVLIYIDLDVADTALAELATSGADAPASTGSSSNDIILRTLYDIKISFGDDSTLILHNLNLPDLASITVEYSPDGIGYVVFSALDGSTGSTLESERALVSAEAERLAEEARIAAELEAQAQAEAEAEAAAAAAAASQAQYDYNYSSGSASGSQSADTCVPDIIFNP